MACWCQCHPAWIIVDFVAHKSKFRPTLCHTRCADSSAFYSLSPRSARCKQLPARECALIYLPGRKHDEQRWHRHRPANTVWQHQFHCHADTIQIEASGGQAVELTGTGQYVQFTAQAAANALVLRWHCVLDTVCERRRDKLDHQSLHERSVCGKAAGNLAIFLGCEMALSKRTQQSHGRPTTGLF